MVDISVDGGIGRWIGEQVDGWIGLGEQMNMTIDRSLDEYDDR